MPDEAQSVERLRTTLAEAGAVWTPGVTSMSSLAPEYARLRLGYTPGPGEPSLAEREEAARSRAPMAAAAGAPARFDWREAKGQNFVSAVRDQGGCGSCVAVA